jgi:hypothetical protein
MICINDPFYFFAYTLEKVLIKLFSKACEVKGEQPLSPLASGEMPLSAFLFC